MLVLGHVGITFGAAIAGEAIRRQRNERNSLSNPLAAFRRSTVSLSQRIDLRLLAIASLLPDIIDKPLGLLIYPSALGSGRLFCHTIWFPAVLFAAAAIVRSIRIRRALLVLAFGGAMHLLLDFMWRTPATLFRPLLEPSQQGSGLALWFEAIVRALTSNPCTYVPEITGAILLALFITPVVRTKSVTHFLKTGVLAQ